MQIDKFYSEAHGEWQEDVPCPWCRESERRLLLETTDRVYHRPGRYGVVRCAACELIYVTPRPTLDSLAHHYPADYFCYHAPQDMPWLMRGSMARFNQASALQRLAYIEESMGRQLPPRAKVLDVGCGIGDLAFTLQHERRCSVKGVDFTASAVEWARTQRGLDIERGTLVETRYTRESFDLVTMIEYLEHEYDPRSVLLEARRILKPGGHLALEIPHPTAWPAKLFRNNWWNLHVPRHLVLFSPDTVTRALAELGFESIQVRPFSFPYNMGLNLSQALGLPYRSRHHYLYVAIASLLGLPLLPLTRWMPEFLFVTARVPETRA